MCCSYLVEPLPNCAPRRWVRLYVCTRTRMHHHHAETVGSAATEPSGFEHGMCQRSGGITKYKRKTLEPDEKDTACTETTIVVPHLSCHRDLSQFATCPPWTQIARRASQSCLDTDCMPCILHHAAILSSLAKTACIGQNRCRMKEGSHFRPSFYRYRLSASCVSIPWNKSWADRVARWTGAETRSLQKCSVFFGGAHGATVKMSTVGEEERRGATAHHVTVTTQKTNNCDSHVRAQRALRVIDLSERRTVVLLLDENDIACSQTRCTFFFCPWYLET